jgi:hypothetical protein
VNMSKYMMMIGSSVFSNFTGKIHPWCFIISNSKL